MAGTVARDNIAPPGRELATLGGGCFWCLEAVFDDMKGIEAVESGYMGGHVVNPTYEAVCDGRTGHIEVVRLTFDPQLVSYREILGVFFAIHDPTTPDRQGNDSGPQYASAIFTHSDAQAGAAVHASLRIPRRRPQRSAFRRTSSAHPPPQSRPLEQRSCRRS